MSLPTQDSTHSAWLRPRGAGTTCGWLPGAVFAAWESSSSPSSCGTFYETTNPCECSSSRAVPATRRISSIPLGIYEAQQALRLDSVICLVDALDTDRILRTRSPTEWSQIQSADVLLLSKPDLAGEPERRAFDEIAAAQYPAKRYVGSCRHGELPPEALQKFERSTAFTLLRGSGKTAAHSTALDIGGLSGRETQIQQLGLWAVNWILPRELIFSRVVIEPRLTWLLEAYSGWLQRLKAVFRTGPGPSWLVQSHGRGLWEEDSAYRRDSRIEIVRASAPTPEFLEVWRSLLRDAANP